MMVYPLWPKSWTFEFHEWVMHYGCYLHNQQEFAVRDVVRGLPYRIAHLSKSAASRTLAKPLGAIS